MTRKILVIRLRMLGDTLLTTPLLRQLPRIYPQADVDVLCEPASELLLRHNPHVRRRFVLPRRQGSRRFAEMVATLRAQHYDLIIDTQSMPKTALLGLLAGAPQRTGRLRRRWRDRLFYTRFVQTPALEYCARFYLRLIPDPGADLDDVGVDFPICPADQAAASKFAKQYLRRPTAAIFTGAKHLHRSWPADNFARVADALAEQGYQPFLVYGPGQEGSARAVAQRMRHEALVDYPMISFGALKGVLEQCDLFVGNDSGPRHVAIAAGIPTVGLIGYYEPTHWTPPGVPWHRFVAPRYFEGERPAYGTCEGYSLDDITPETVLDQVASAVAARRVA